MRQTLTLLREKLSDPTRKINTRVEAFVQRAIAQYELAVKASIGMPTYSDDVTLQYEAPTDIPTAPLSGYQLIQRTAYIVKLATVGTTAGGFNAILSSTDLAPYVSSSTGSTFFRVKKVTSWTAPRADGSLTQGTFAGVSVAPTTQSGGTEVMPTWYENWTPVGQGFAGIVTHFPLGDFPQLSSTSAETILTHFTALGGTGGVTGVPVIFHVQIECLV